MNCYTIGRNLPMPSWVGGKLRVRVPESAREFLRDHREALASALACEGGL